MKRWLANLAIVAYLGALGFGIFAHTVRVGATVHPAMYFVVWDMFCGWGAYSMRTHIIGEGQSGKYYEVAPGPWGEFKPFGSIGRRHYDDFNFLIPRLIENNLKHSQHEPMTRVYVVNEFWPKKYNVPPALWATRYDPPPEQYSYYYLRSICAPDGRLLTNNPTWHYAKRMESISDNPRLVAQQQRAQPFLAIRPSPSVMNSGSSNAPVGARLGN